MSDTSELLADVLKEEGDRESLLQPRRNTYWLPIAERVVERGWRPPPRLIETVDQLSALPIHAVVHDGRRAYSHQGGGWWIAPGFFGSMHSETVLESDLDGIASVPVAVIWETNNE
ncbi:MULTISPECIES: hypothetical protein [Nocardia]|uniref:hypothetical protein n=1 Tax=Nocardia TaxID=1817 RepID=UPI001300BE4F|nr:MULTISPECIES: hypothetical protein [Nocardia]